jgi:hypothetical protein
MGSAGDVMIDQGVLRGFSRPLREWFFILAFASIGLSSNFREMAHHFKGGKPAILYVCGQSFNLILTLLMAYIMFFLVFPGITAGLMEYFYCVFRSTRKSSRSPSPSAAPHRSPSSRRYPAPPLSDGGHRERSC